MAVYRYLGGRPLQHFYAIDIVDDGDSWDVYFISSIHVTGRLKLPNSYSKQYSHEEILRDGNLINQINARYGKVTKPDAEAPF